MIETQLDADGVLLARIDMPGRAMNVFSRELMDALERLMADAAADAAVKAVVLTSGKAAFLAGADLEMIRMFTERARGGATDELHDLFGHLGRLFRRLELHPKPFVAAINGLALGGGLEVCMACQGRVLADDPAIQLGLPEIKLGLLPGAGGTQRLPRLIGAEAGLRMLLDGEPVSPGEAMRLGLVDELVPAEQLIEAAKRRALTLQGHQAPWDREGARFSAAPFDFAAPDVQAVIARTIGIDDYRMHRYPAYRAIMQCVSGGWNLPMTMAGEHEMSVFVKLMRDPVAGNMVRTLFLNRQKAAKLGLLGPASPYSAGERALLPRLRAARDRAQALGGEEEQTLLAVAFAAVEAWSEGGVELPELADVAAVNAGLFPAWTGGPYTYLRQAGAERLRAEAAAAAPKDAALFAVPGALERFLRPLSNIAA
jgi:3-hydroxyacyl-CoA dehydrogenase/enoyl-CoA hydratase/3-hydroxybutyryl-CoA epimerase